MITVAYIGFGVSIREYHIPYVEKRDDMKIKYICRREEDIPQFAEYEPYYSDITFVTDVEDILRDEEVDLVVCGAPDRFHVPYAKQILEAGKHALIEKPFAPTAAEAREVFDLATEKRLICMPNQNRRYDADFLALRQVLESGKIGQMVRLESHFDYFRTNGSFTLPPVIHNSGKKKVVGRHVVNTAPAPEERWGTLVWHDGNGAAVTEKVPVGCAHYERIYDSMLDAIENGPDRKVVKDEEVCKVLEILETATDVAKSHAK